MKCKQIRSQFYDYADDSVAQVARSAIESHLSGCDSCRKYYEAQRNLHHSIAGAVAGELAGMHFQSMPIKAEPSNEDRRSSFHGWGRRMAVTVPCLLILSAALWLIRTPSPEPVDDAAPPAYAEAIHYLEMHSADRFGASSFTMPLAVIIRPGAPARTIVLDGTTDISAEVK